MNILKKVMLFGTIMALLFSAIVFAEEAEPSQETIVTQVSEQFGDADIRDRSDIVSSFGSIMEDNQIIVFELTSRIILFINFKGASQKTYMWTTDDASDESLQNVYGVLHAYAECSTISDNNRCFYMYVDDSGSNSFFLSTTDGTKFDEGEEYYSTIDELIIGIIETKHPKLNDWLKTII